MIRSIQGLLIGVSVFFGMMGSVCAAEGPAGDKQIVTLASEEPGTAQNADMGLLVRELARQAVLIAAREELGLPTRDQTLREPFPADAGQPLEIHTLVTRAGDSMKIELTRKGAAGVIWSGDVPCKLITASVDGKVPPPSKTDLVELAKTMEPFTRGPLVEALKKAGYSGSPLKTKAAPNTATKAEALLDQFYFLPQFHAVRAAHEAAAQGGVSPDLTGVLVRGYANLGQLTLPYWNATPKVFIARSLLYAQRMVNADPKSPLPLWHRAYARALAGQHAAAKDDLRVAAELANGQRPPSWVDAVRALCAYDTAALVDIAAGNKRQAPLAMFFCFLTIEYSTSQSLVMEMGQAARDVNPLCYRLVEGMAPIAGVGPMHELSSAGHSIISSSLLADMQALPAETRGAFPKNLRSPGAEALTFPADVAKALLRAGDKDTVEPSWGVLGRMVQEMNFLSVHRMVYFQRAMLGTDADDYLQAARPLIAEHPYRIDVEALAMKPGTNPQQITNMGKGINVIDAEFNELPMLYRFQLLTNNSTVPDITYASAMSRHSDAMPRDIYLEFTRMGQLQSWAKLERAISPDSAWAIAALIEVDWPTFGPRAAELERQYGYHPDVRAAFARKYVALGERDNAIRNLEAYIKKAPDPWAYQQLADLHLAAGNEAKWLATLKEFLTKEDFGLNHATVQVAVAKHFMDKGDYKTALPFADAAAISGAAWAMETSAECHSGLGQWTQAEALMLAVAERYDTPLALYFWCRKTSHGNVGRARQMVKAALAQADPYEVGSFYLAEGDNAHALEAFRASYARGGDLSIYSAMYAASILDAQGEAAARDEVLESVARKTKVSEENARGVELAKQMLKLVAGGIDPKTDRATAQSVMPESLKDRAGSARYLAGKFLAVHGQTDLAKEFFLHCFFGADLGSHSEAFAAVELQKLGVAPPYGQSTGK